MRGMVIKSLAVFCLPLVFGCSMSGEGSLPCGEGICVFIADNDGYIEVSVFNNSNRIVYVPWINGADSIFSGFRVERSDGYIGGGKAGSGLELPIDGAAMLIPGGVYGLYLSKEDVKYQFELGEGCQEVKFIFDGTGLKVGDDNIVKYVESEFREVCL